MGAERQLRFVQIACVLVVVMSIRISLMVQGTTHGSSLIQWTVIVLAFSCALQGFTLQRRIGLIGRDKVKVLRVGARRVTKGPDMA